MSDTIHVKVPKDLLLWLRGKAKTEERSPGWLLRKFAQERMEAAYGRLYTSEPPSEQG